MKKFLTVLLIFAMALSLAGCSGGTGETGSRGEQASGGDTAPQNTTQQETEQHSDASNVENEELSREEFDAVWTKLFGYWNAAEQRFIVFDAMDSNTTVFSEGLWATSYERFGTVTDAAASGEQELTLTVLYRATEATEMDDALPEMTASVVVDYSGLEQDGKIRVKLGDEDWYQYMFAGNTSEEAYETYVENENPA